MMGALADDDCTIVESWFDVVDPQRITHFNQVAIGDLLFLPA
jgi:hypothetical protein